MIRFVSMVAPERSATQTVHDTEEAAKKTLTQKHADQKAEEA
jgi:hypothetical protein